MVHVVFNLTTSGKQVYMPVPLDLAQAIPLAQGNTIKLTDDELWLT